MPTNLNKWTCKHCQRTYFETYKYKHVLTNKHIKNERAEAEVAPPPANPVAEVVVMHAKHDAIQDATPPAPVVCTPCPTPPNEPKPRGWTGWRRVRRIKQSKCDSDSDESLEEVDIHPLNSIQYIPDEDDYYGSIEWLYDV